MPAAMKPGDEWVTYERADGEAIYGEYDFVTDLGYFDEDDEPTKLLRKTWWLVAVEEVTVNEREPDEDDDEPEAVPS